MSDGSTAVAWRVASTVAALLRRMGFVRLLRWPARFRCVTRTRPIDRHWGSTRGRAIDRYYIERFLDERSPLFRGRILEVMDDRYATAYGREVTSVDILDIDRSNAAATIVADLGQEASLPAGRFDCAVIIQTLQFVSHLPTAVRNLYQALAPGGSLIVSMPSVSKLDEALQATEHWRVTPQGLARVLRDACPDGTIEVEGFGNVLVATAFLYGLAQPDLSAAEIDDTDPLFPVVVCGVATKPKRP